MPRRQPRFEEAGGQRLPLGGVNGYYGVRGKQGKKRNQFQGHTPRKTKEPLTDHYDTAKEAAIARTQMLEDISLGMTAPKKAQPPPANDPSKTARYLGELLRQQRTVVPTVRAVLLSRQQAAAAVARGVAVAYAEPVG